MVRALYQTYDGPIYQVRRKSDKTTLDIYPLAPGGVANSAAVDTFLKGGRGTVSIIYDQSGHNNNLTVSPGGCYVTQADTEATATGDSVMLGGHKVYGLYQIGDNGYRKDTANDVPTTSKPQGLYFVVNGKHYNIGCCYDYGNAETNRCSGGTGTMECLYFGNTNYWATGAGAGPWVMADLEGGLWPGGSGASSKGSVYSANPTLNYNYVTGFLKGEQLNSTPTYELRDGSAQSGALTTIYDGNAPSTWKLTGSFILGIGGDNSNSSVGTFYEGAMTAGWPPDSTENAVQKNIIAAGYGQTTATLPIANGKAPSPFTVRYNPSNADAVISYALQNAGRMSINIFDPQGRHVAAIFDGINSAGRHESVWDTKSVHAGIYIVKIAIDGRDGGTGRIVIGK